jgi:hypothetical protein
MTAPCLSTRLLRDAAALVLDLALFCDMVKPALFKIAEFVLFLVGLVTIVWLVLRHHGA